MFAVRRSCQNKRIVVSACRPFKTKRLKETPAAGTNTTTHSKWPRYRHVPLWQLGWKATLVIYRRKRGVMSVIGRFCCKSRLLPVGGGSRH